MFSGDSRKNIRSQVEDLKTVISSSPILQFYDPQLQTRLTMDASQNGLGGHIRTES